MKVSETLTTSSALSSEDFKATQKWITDLFDSYDNKDPLTASKYFSEEINVVFPSIGTAVGGKALQKFYLWTYAGLTKFDWDLKSLHGLPNQIVSVVDGVAHYPLGKPTAFSLVLIFDKDVKNAKATGVKLYGDLVPVVAKIIEKAGPIHGLSSLAAVFSLKI